VALKYFEYMKMPLELFPTWIVDQYNLKKHSKNGWMYLKMHHTMWDLPQAGILANKCLQ
jgi:hypothetical protein